MGTLDAIQILDVGMQAGFCGIALWLSLIAARRSATIGLRRLAYANGALAIAAVLGTSLATLTTNTEWFRHPPLVAGYIAFVCSISLFVCSRTSPTTQDEYGIANWISFFVSTWILVDTSSRFELPAWLIVLYGAIFSVWAIVLLQRWRRAPNTIAITESQNQAEPQSPAV